MSRFNGATLLLALLLVPTAVSGYGAWLFYCALLKGNHTDAGRAMFVLFGGMTVVPAVLVALANRFIKSEGAIAAHSVQRRRVSKLGIHKKEKLIRRMYFLKRHPSIVFLFVLIALVVSTAMVTAPAWGLHPHDPNASFLQLFGIALFLAYFIVLLSLIYGVISKKWEPYMKASIEKLEKQLAEVKAKAGSA